jgi:hypothetical protein
VLGQLVEIYVGEAERSQSTSHRRSMEFANCTARSEVTHSVCAVARPGTISRPMCLSFGDHSSAVATASSVLGKYPRPERAWPALPVPAL